MRSLVWFRSDLRTGDNPALHQACRESTEGVIAAFLVSSAQWNEHDWGSRKIGYLRECLKSLAKDLGEIGIPLVVEEASRFDDAPAVLDRIVSQHRCDAVYFNREYESNEISRDRRVSLHLEARGVEVRGLTDQTLFRPGSILTQKGEPYSVFTPFWRTWSRRLDEEPPSPLPIPDAASEPVTPVDDLFHGSIALDGGAPTEASWITSEAAALRSLGNFFSETADEYHHLRDQPAVDATSGLSAALSLGVVSPRSCLEEALLANEGHLSGESEGIEAWIRQLAWRDFYRHVVAGFPRVSRGKSFLPWTDGVEWRQSDSDFAAWREGRTGVPLVDAGMRQLLNTGWIHNRIRMVTAMFLSKDLLLDWRLGEAHFMHQLVDGDFANNNGGWQWSASTGVDAAPYFRIMNPWTQGRRFDLDGEYIRTWVPELSRVESRDLHDEGKLAARIDSGLHYPRSIVSHRSARIRAIAAFEAAKQRQEA